VVALALQRRYLARRSYVTLGGKGHRPLVVPLGGARWGALAFCAGVFVLAVLAPYVTLLAVSISRSWGLGFWQKSDPSALSLRSLRVRRHPSGDREQLAPGGVGGDVDRPARQRDRMGGSPTRVPDGSCLDYVSLVPLGLPGIVMAVALIQFWLRVPVPIYGTLLIILLAYSARYVPLAVRSANAAFRQVDPSLEETARVTGAGWLRTFGSITLPLARPGLVAGWLLVFVPAIQELSASVLLFSSGSMTLAVAVYNLYETGISARSPRWPS
jgi:iron(III) transport system permease protein